MSYDFHDSVGEKGHESDVKSVQPLSVGTTQLLWICEIVRSEAF